MGLEGWMKAVLAGLVLAPLCAAPAFAQDGPTVFKERRCTKCHSVTAAEIQKAPKKAGEKAEDGEEEEPKDSKKNMDLSGVGAEHDAAWITGFMKKKEKKDGKAHKPKWKGTDEELQALASWLATMKTKAPGK